MPTAAAASGLAGFWRLPAARRRGMSTEGAAAGLELVFPLLGHPPSVGFWGGGRRERSDAPCLRPQPQQRLASGPSPAVRPPLPPLPSLVQAGVAAWAQLAPVSGPPLVPLTLPDGGRVEGTLRSQPPLATGWDREPVPGFLPGPRAQQPPSSAPRLLRRCGTNTACRCPCAASPQAPEALARKRGRRETGCSPLGGQREAWQKATLTPRPSLSFLPGDSCITAN